MDLKGNLLVIQSILIAMSVVNASENIASGKTTNQSSTIGSWASSKAVDGCTSQNIGSNCCTHTAAGHSEVWWQVDLQTPSVIDTVTIIYRNWPDTKCTCLIQDWTSGTLCHKDTTPNLASMSHTQNVNCPGVARYLTIYNDRRVIDYAWYSTDAILELCEVQVYGCPVGKYGNGHCTNDCSNCLDDICDTTSGTCECNGGFYGSSCTVCPIGCTNGTCNTTLGYCFQCVPGVYGPNCTETCPASCPDKCERNTGECNAKVFFNVMRFPMSTLHYKHSLFSFV